MLCPVCKTTNLVMTERQAIEIDYCPQCRGVWLDRGELDKIIERTVAVPPRAAEATRMRDPREEYREREREYDRGYKRDDDRRHYEHKHYKKKSLLGELFDF